MGMKLRIQSWRRSRASDDDEDVRETARAITIPCGICRRKYSIANLEKLFAHLNGHFDDKRRLNRCHDCGINFVTQADLNEHLYSARKANICGYLFEHKQTCSGHHPPHRNVSQDDSRFDFCYRLQGWESAQLQQEQQARDGADQSTTHKHSRKTSALDFIRVHLRRPSATSTPTSGSSPPPPSTSPASNNAGPKPKTSKFPAQDLLNAILLRAVCTGCVPLVTSIFHAGAQPTFTDTLGYGAMHYVAQYGTPKIAWMLLQNGASVAQPDRRGNTPLFHAIRAANTDVVHRFLAWGKAHVAQKDIDEAVDTGNREIVAMVLEYWRREEGVGVLDAALLRSVRNGDVGVVKVLLRHGARTNGPRDDEGKGPLMVAIERGDLSMVNLLRQRGKQSDGWSEQEGALWGRQ